MSQIDREEAIRLIASYPGPVDKSVVRRLLTQMDEVQDEPEYWHEKASSYEQTIVRLCETRTWIPVTERLPEEPYGCLVTVWDTNPITMDEFENLLPYFVGWDGEQWNDGDGEQCPFEVIAWMPLPKPYEGGEQDDQ